jgi:hypothetical protein
VIRQQVVQQLKPLLYDALGKIVATHLRRAFNLEPPHMAAYDAEAAVSGAAYDAAYAAAHSQALLAGLTAEAAHEAAQAAGIAALEALLP